MRLSIDSKKYLNAGKNNSIFIESLVFEHKQKVGSLKSALSKD